MVSLATLQDSFVTYLPHLRRLARYAFRHLEPERRAEAVSNTIALCWKAWHRLGELDKARQNCEIATEIDPNHAFAWSNLGAVYDAQGDAYRAIAAYLKSIDLDPSQPPVHVNLGTAYLKQGRLDKALEEFKIAIAMDPESPIARKRIAYVYSKEKKYHAAIEQLQTVLEKTPEDWECRNSLAAIFMIYYLRHPEQDRLRLSALEEWHQSLQTRPEQPTIKDQLARWSKPLPPSEWPARPAEPSADAKAESAPASGDVKPEARPETKASADLRPETKVDLKAALETKAVASEVQKKP